MFEHLRSLLSKLISKSPLQGAYTADPLNLTISTAYNQFLENNYPEAEFLVVRAFEQCDDNTDPRIIEWIVSILNTIWFQQEADAKAADFFSRLISRFPNSVAAHYALGFHLWLAGRVEGALRGFDSCLALVPGSARALSARGQILAELGESRRAIADLEQALGNLQGEPDTEFGQTEIEAYTRNGLGAALASNGENQEAMRQFELSIALRPENGWVYFNRARAYELQNQPVEALTDYHKAVICAQPKLPAYKRRFAEERIRQLTSNLL